MKQHLCSFGKFLLSLLWRLAVCVLLGALLLSAVYCLPTEPIRQNVAASAADLAQEGAYPVLFSWCPSQLDNYTDSIMMLEAGYDGPGSPLELALQSNYPTIRALEENPFEVLTGHYCDGLPFDGTISYTRYWHGYLLYMKPLLYVTTYQTIRTVNGLLQLAVLGLLLYLLYKRGLRRLIAPLLATLAMAMPLTFAMSMQFSSCYYVTTLGCIALLLRRDLPEKEHYVLLYTGIATAFFDFLTYPIVTVAIPAALCYCLHSDGSLGRSIWRMVKQCVSWCFGYGLMWASKWVCASFFSANNPIADALSGIAERTASGEEAEGSFVHNLIISLYSNIKTFLSNPALLLVLALAALLLVLVVVTWRRRGFRLMEAVVLLVPFVLIACMPIVWYGVLTNHSTVHYFFTHKALMASVFGGLAGLAQLRHQIENQ